MRGKPFVDKRFSPAPPSKKLFSGGAAAPRRWTVGSGQRPVDRENRKRKALLPSSSCFWCVWRAVRAQRTFERMSGIEQKRGGQSAFRVFVLGAGLFVREPCLSWPFLPGDRQWGLSGVVPGSPSSCIKRVGRRMGAWGKEGPLRASRRPKAAAGRARCDEGSYGHRQQGKVPPSPKKLAYMWKKRRGGTPGIMRASASLR